MRALIVDDSRFVRGYVRGCSSKEESNVRKRAMGRPRWIVCVWITNSILSCWIGTCR